jgi:hypothetical protein
MQNIDNERFLEDTLLTIHMLVYHMKCHSLVYHTLNYEMS